MAARKRRHNESYIKYRKNLIKEAIEEKERLSGKMKFTAVRYFRKLAAKIWQKETRTYLNRDRKLIKTHRQASKLQRRSA